VSDIVTRLRRWTHAVNAAPASDLMDEAADEIENLRTAIRRLADQDATLSVCDGNVTVTMDGTLTDEYRTALAGCVAEKAADWKAACESAEAASKEFTRLKLTRYERHCIERVRDTYADEDDVECNEIAAVIDGLLERTK